jgi:hypothetical protein
MKPPITVPLKGFYGRDPAREKARSTMYAAMHMVFGLQGWAVKASSAPIGDQIGFDGMPPVIRGIGPKSSIKVNINAAPFEWMRETGRLQTGIDAPGADRARVQAGEYFRTICEGARVTSLRSPDLGGVGGRSGRPGSLSDHRLDCMAKVNRVKQLIGDSRKATILEQVIVDDVFTHIRDNKGRPIVAGLEAVRIALDIIALDMNLITARAFRSRWPAFSASVVRRKSAV